jgi:hypothetical protein
MGRLEEAKIRSACSILALDPLGLYPLLTKERVIWRVVVKAVLKFRVPRRVENFLAS